MTTTKDRTNVTTSKHNTTALSTNITTNKQNTDAGFFTSDLFSKGMDAYGCKSINILGDSISHGANAPRIPEDSYVALLKKSMAQKYGVYNYGFTSMLYSIDNANGVYNDLHSIIKTGNWGIGAGEGAGGHLGFHYYKSLSKDASLTFSIDRKEYKAVEHTKGFYVYYGAGPGQGSFRVEAGGQTLATIDCSRDKSDTCARSSYIALPSGLGEKINIRIVKTGNDLPITITGMGYAERPDAVTLNNYSRSGLQLVEVSNDVLKSVCRSNVLILALGFNDAGLRADHLAFKNKINLIIRSCEASGAKLVVLDTIWTFAEDKEFYRAELKRAADESGGKYIRFTKLYSQNPTMIQDGAHPSVEGHRLIAQYICEELGLPFKD